MATTLTYSLLLLAGSFFTTFLLVPKISNIMYRKKILDAPNVRSSHTKSVPNLGGIAFYIVLMLSFYFIEDFDTDNLLKGYTPALTVLFILGLKDDLLSLSPRVKFAGQVFACALLISNEHLLFDDFHGFLGFHEIATIPAYIITLLFVIFIINAFNLIDGINGLASVVACVILFTFGVLFALEGMVFLTSVCTVLIGAIIAFLRFNLSSKKRIFMGDTGSMILGFTIALMSCAMFNMMCADHEFFTGNKSNIPYLLIGILIVPIFDTLRIIIIRLFNRRSPFSPDRNHTHHILTDFKGFSHLKTSITFGIFNLISITCYFIMAISFKQWTLFIVSILVFLGLMLYFFVLNKNFGARKTKYKLMNGRSAK